MLIIQFTYDEQNDENNPSRHWNVKMKELNEKMEKKRKQEQEKRQYEFFTVSTRSSIDEEWCSYSVQKIFETEFSTSSSVYKWVYYTHKPTGLWIEYQNQCDGFAGRIIAGAYKLSASYEDFSPLRYIWVAPDQSDVLLLHCHRDKDPLTGKEFYIGIIKTLKNEYLFSIVGLECWTSLNSNEHHYMRLTAIDQHKYVSIGLRESEEKEWCRYDLCVDCKDIIPKLQVEEFSFGKLIIWSQAAVEWKRGNTEDYEYNKEKIKYKMISNGKTQFILMCKKTMFDELYEGAQKTRRTTVSKTRGRNKETTRIEYQKKEFSKNGNVLMSASGAFMANVDFVCKYSNIFKWLFYFVTESMDGKLSLHTSRDCERGCDVDVDKQRTIKESWLYYSAAENIEQYKPFKFYTIYQGAEKDCNNLKKEDIKTTVQTSMSAKLMSEYRTGKRFNIKISCYVVEEQNKLTYHADVTYKDNPLIRIEGLNCKKKENVIDRLAVTIPGNEDTSQVVIGYKESASTNWCSYNVMKIPDSGSYEIERYYGYVPDELTLQWYENNPYVNCPSLKKNNILVKKWENSDTELKNNEAKTYVGNLNDKYIMLHCIKKIVSNKEVYTSVFTSMDKEGDFSVTVEGLDCSSKSDLQKFGIYFWNPADLEYIILETVIPEKHLEVCRYDIELDMDKPQVYMNLRTTFETNIFLWSEVENKDCSFFKWENVHTEENKELWSQVPESIEIGYLHIEDQTTKILKDVFVTYTYSEKEPNNIGAKVCTMVIRNDRGRHLARIEQMECSRSWTLYMFRYSEYQDHLIVGGMSVSESDNVHSVCQYDICITCQEKNVRFNTHFPTDQEKTAIRWVKDHEKIAVNAPSRKNQHVKFDAERLKIRYISEKTPLFYIECHMTGSKIYSKNYGVLRTYTGLIIGTIKEKNCDSVNSVNEIHLRYLVSKTGDGYILVHDLNITDPPDYETGSCWFYGCSTSPINEILVFYDVVPRPQQSQPSIWARVTVLPSKPCPNIDSSSSFLKKPKNEESSVVTKFVDSKNYKLECYFNSNDLEYTAVIYDSQGNYIITLVDYDCSSIKNLQNKVEIVTEENKSDVDVNFIFISPFTSCGISSYTLCPDCEKEKELIIFKPNLKVNSEWTQVSTDQCHTSSEQTIITDAGLIDLNGYKVNKIYINEDETDENVFILRCLGKQGSEDVYTRLDSLDGQHIFYLRNADCITLEKLTTRMYIAIARIKEHRYLAVGTRTDVKGTFSPWCRYDICLNCEKVDKHVHYNFESDPFNLLTFKWSMSSLETELQSGFDATRMQYVTKNVHRKHTEYSTECYFDPARNMKRTAIKLNMKPLLAVYDHECITRNFLFRTFYIYTSYKDSKYSLFRMGQEKEAKPELLENEIEKLFFWFIEKDAPEERPWRQVGNPKVETQDKDVEDLMCTPRAKTINDLSYKVFRAKDGDDDGD